MSYSKYLNYLLWFCLCLATQSGNAQTASALRQSVNQFLSTLNADELRQATHPFDDTLRTAWSNLPVGLSPRVGIQYGSLTASGKLAFHRVLTGLLSAQGYLKTTSIMAMDDILNTLFKQAFDEKRVDEKTYQFRQSLKWSHGNYFITIWGKPDPKAPWGLSFSGHHICLNITVKGESIKTTPFFYGAYPAEVKLDKYAGLRILSKEEDYGFSLLHLLTKAQQRKAILSQAVPEDVITNPKSTQRITTYSGIAARELDANQKDLLRILINEYMHNYEHATAHRLLEKMEKSGFDNVHFSWIGSLEPNKPHYYLIHAPDFLIEYDNDGLEHDGNHIHVIVREKEGDFGYDLLKQHYLQVKH